MAGPDPEQWVFFGGEFCRYKDARLGLLTHTLHYGTGCFEGIRAYWDAASGQLNALLLDEHYGRLLHSARILGMTVPYDVAELCALTTQLLRANDYREDVYIRPLVYKAGEELGARIKGVADGFAIVASRYTTPVGADNGLRCRVSSWRRVDDNAIPARAKVVGAYVNSSLAKSEAEADGYDEAILLNQDGHVCEASTSNLFLYRNDELATPQASDNILEGITRRLVMRLARDEGLRVAERSIDRSELYIADEIFLSGTGIEIAPVVAVDMRPVATGRPGPLARQLRTRYVELCLGRLPRYADLLRPTYST